MGYPHRRAMSPMGSLVIRICSAALVRRRRMMMRTTSAPIGEIAAGCGYPNQLHFSQAFKKRYGLPPREWRRENGISPADLARRERGGT